jgi:hypothetical protein
MTNDGFTQRVLTGAFERSRQADNLVGRKAAEWIEQYVGDL